MKDMWAYFLGVCAVAGLVLFCLAMGWSIGNEQAVKNGFFESKGKIYHVTPADVVAKGE